MASPLVSIITATFNRSNVLRLAIESTLWQTFQDWELLIIGDACTDDTEQVVASFDDPRIHFCNLSENVGEQSGPNNEGFRRARGRYIAYLNHDDLWLPDHLEAALEGIEKTGADMVFSLVDAVLSEGRNALWCAVPGGLYEPGLLVPASCWLCRREMIEEVGPWRFYQECHSVPSQDWLYRAWKAGKDMRLVSSMTVVAIFSGTRQGVYSNREARENQLYFQRIRDETDFRAKELTSIATNYATPWLRWYPVPTLLLRALRNTVARICVLAGIDPIAARNFLVHLRKGGFIDGLRRRRGLELLERRGSGKRKQPLRPEQG